MKITSDSIELSLHQSSENSRGYWVGAACLERLWALDLTGSHTSESHILPRSKYFSMDHDADELGYWMPSIQILVQPEDNAVRVHSGAHRLRWLLSSGVIEVPVSVYRDVGIKKGGTGLILRPVQANDVIRVKNNFDCEMIIAEKLALRTSMGYGIFDRLFQPHQVDGVAPGH